jgi:hypothetical protein
MVLKVLREHQLYEKFSKCDLYKKEIQYLGHVISAEGVVVDPKNFKAITDWPNRRKCDRSEILHGIGKIGNPITLFQRKGKKIVWLPECESSFQQLEHILTDVPILRIADPEKDFLVYTDACKEGLDGVLMQEGQVICYESRKLNKHE